MRRSRSNNPATAGRIRTTRWLGIAGIAVLTGAGCGTANDSSSNAPETWDEVVEIASSEGPVVWYTANREPTITAITEAFAEAYPDIQLEPTRMVGADLTARLNQERENDLAGFTVATTDATSLWALADDDDLVPLSDLPAFREVVTNVYDNDAYVGPGETFGLTSAELVGIMWNTDIVTEDIRDYSDWTERSDEFANGKLGITPVNNAAYASFVVGIEEGIDGESVLTSANCCREPDFLAQLAELKPLVYSSGVPLGNAIAAGEVAAGWLTGSATYEVLRDQGAPVKFVESTEAPFTSNHFTGIRKGSESVNASKVFVNWMFEENGGQAVIASTGTMPLYSDLPGAPGDISQMVPHRQMVDDKEFMESYNARFQELFGSGSVE